ncbi:TolB family protein [Alteribacillus iranensis]|uniref:Uncharacterized protein n=1 Tax=Alteribacillus iranensis TaxID=930128 RepID=A0A1I2F3C0_9BACI|nr:DUF5050 domain-containing protein [Alteribacillus iranensis]SFE99327.1 protein of unknown function [Alteribacillus iranensis]
MTGGDSISNNRILCSLIGLVGFLFIASLAYSVLKDNDPYKHFTGLGDTISISTDDTTIAFSYYKDGKEAIYTGNVDGKNVEKITEPEEKTDHRQPQFSPDGKGLIYVAANPDGVQTIHYQSDLTSDETRPLTGTDHHVFSTAFSPDGSTVYYIAMPAEDFQKPEGEKENGAELYSVDVKGNPPQKLTDKDSYAMNELSVSADGENLYYTAFRDKKEQLFSYNLETGTEQPFLEEHTSDGVYHPAFSPNEDFLAYTAVADTSENGTFQYGLYLMDLSSGESTRLTDYNASVTSPVFFHQEDRIALLVESNWPSEPSSYEVMTVSYDGKEAAPIELDLPESENDIQLKAIADNVVNPLTMTVLYLLLFGLLTVYFHKASQKTYFPAKLSAILSGIVFASSFAGAAYNGWAGIGLFMIAVWLFVCTAVLFLFAFVYRWFVRRSTLP